MLKPIFWHDTLEEDFRNRVIKYIDDEVDLYSSTAGYYDDGTPRYDKCSMTAKIKIWNFHEDENDIEKEIGDVMFKLAIKANDFFDFNLNYNNMILQLAKFEESDNAHFGWHADDHINFEQDHRKLSFSVFLKPAKKGGNLLVQDGWEILPNENNTELPYLPSTKVEETPGKVVAFPSYCNHCVTPVEEGDRYSLVAWIFGPEWR